MKKFSKKLFVIFLSVISIVSSIMNVNAETVLETFNADRYTYKAPISSYPEETLYLDKTLAGKVVYCIYYARYAPKPHVTYTKGSLITDNGMNYILNKSYSATSDLDIFIHKSALQLYMVDKGIMPGPHTYLDYFNSSIKNDNSEIAKKIKTLIAEAKKAGANDTSAPTIKVDTGSNTFALSSDGKYYVSNAVTVTSSTGSYTVSLTSAPTGSTVEKKGNTFTIKVPADKVTELVTSISFKVNNSKNIYTSYKYNPNDDDYQVLATTFKNTKTANATGTLTLKRTASVPFLKVDAETGEAISGAELKLTNSKGEVIKTWTSSTKAENIALGEGSYTLTETKAPDGYKAIETSVKFSIDKQGNILNANGEKITKVVITNERKTGGVEISKQDITNKEELPGATLQIKDSKGNVIEEWVSTDKPHYIKKLTPGKYTLTETIAPEGYILSEETITFEIKDDGSITKVVMYNTPKTGGVEISKQDITNKEELPGATLQIKDSEGNIIDEWVSTDKPHYIEKLTPGKYTLTETIAPTGYILSEETITFEVKDDGSITKVVMYNTPMPSVEVPVEPTSSFKTMTSSIIGTIIVIAGAYIIFKNSKKKEVM